MTTGPEPTTAPPPKYNSDPAVTGYTPSALAPALGSEDGMLVIAAFRQSGASPWPGMDWFAKKLSELLNGQMGLWVVYGAYPPIQMPPVPTPPPAYTVQRKASVAAVGYYHHPTDTEPYMRVHTTWAMTVLERTGPPNDMLKVLVAPEIWVRPDEVELAP